MADKLLIYYDPNDGDYATWSLVNGSGELVSMITKGELDEASEIAAKHKTVVLLDSKSVYLSSVKLPIKNRQKLLRALPFALEDQIADDVDELHFIAGTAKPNGLTAVAAIHHATIKKILHRFNTAGIEPIAIIPDALCLAANAQQWALLLDNQQATIQLDSFNGTKVDLENLPWLLQSLTNNETQPISGKLLLFSREDENTDELCSNIPESIEIVRVGYNTHPLVVYCGQYQHAMPLNLLQYAYRPANSNSIQWKRWKLAASLAAIWLVLLLGYNSYQQHQLQNKNDGLRVQIEKVYKDAFPDSLKIVNARVQMEQKLKELRSSGQGSADASMIALLSASAFALSTEKNISLQTINFRNQKIDLELTSTTLGTIESLNKKLNDGNIIAEIVSSSSEKDQVKGNIRIYKAAS